MGFSGLKVVMLSHKKIGDAHFATAIKALVWLDYFGGLICMTLSSIWKVSITVNDSSFRDGTILMHLYLFF